MWPWEHLAVGYLLYSTYCRVRGGRPDATGAVAVAVATQTPDLIDKPLAWVFGVLPSGLSLGHSLLLAVPVAVVARAVARPTTAAAVAVGYLSHLAGDVAYLYVVDDVLVVSFLVWPLAPAPGGVATDGLLALLGGLVAKFTAFLATPTGRTYLVGEATLVASAVAVWIADGTPGLPRLQGSGAPTVSDRD